MNIDPPFGPPCGVAFCCVVTGCAAGRPTRMAVMMMLTMMRSTPSTVRISDILPPPAMLA